MHTNMFCRYFKCATLGIRTIHVSHMGYARKTFKFQVVDQMKWEIRHTTKWHSIRIWHSVPSVVSILEFSYIRIFKTFSHFEYIYNISRTILLHFFLLFKNHLTHKVSNRNKCNEIVIIIHSTTQQAWINIHYINYKVNWIWLLLFLHIVLR